MSLKHSYTILAPIYDSLLARATAPLRQRHLSELGDVSGKHILLAGVGTGLDFAHLPAGAHYQGLDLTPAMLKRARARIPDSLDIRLHQGDVMQMPFHDNEFDIVIAHLILAVVPDPLRMLKESARVLRTGGEIYILDKFLRPGQRAPLRRLLNIISQHIATRTDVVLETLLTQCPEWILLDDQPAMAGGWFRFVRMKKATTADHG